MKSNTLFNHIELTKQHKVYKTKQGASYFRLTPQRAHKDLINEYYKVNEEHISVYSQTKEGRPQLEQYHYTAELVNLEQKVFKLHVYFDQWDACDVVTLVSKDNPAEKLKLDEEMTAEFLRLAIAQTQPLINPLKLELSKRIAILEEQHQQAETIACELSKEMDSNPLAYEKKLTEITKILEQLILLTPDNFNDFYRNKQRILHSMIKKLQRQEKAPSLVSVAEKVETETPATAEQSSTVKMVTTFNGLKDQENEAAIDDLLVKLNERKQTILPLDQVNRDNIERTIQTVRSILADINLLILVAESLSKERLTQLQTIYTSTFAISSSLFRPALRMLVLNEVRQMPSHHSQLTQEDIAYALENQQITVLRLLMELNYFHPHIPTQINIAGKQYASPIHYLITVKTPPPLLLITILISHNAPILLPDEQGLPLAYTLLNNYPNFFDAQEIHSKTMGSALFRHTLTTMLENYLKTHNLPEGEDKTIRETITAIKSQRKKPRSNLQSWDGVESRRAEKEMNLGNMKTEIQQVHDSGEVYKLRDEITIRLNQYIDDKSPGLSNAVKNKMMPNEITEIQYPKAHFPNGGVSDKDFHNYYNQLSPEAAQKEFLLTYKNIVSMLDCKCKILLAEKKERLLSSIKNRPTKLSEPLVRLQLSRYSIQVSTKEEVLSALEQCGKEKASAEQSLLRLTQVRLKIVERYFPNKEKSAAPQEAASAAGCRG